MGTEVQSQLSLDEQVLHLHLSPPWAPLTKAMFISLKVAFLGQHSRQSPGPGVLSLRSVFWTWLQYFIALQFISVSLSFCFSHLSKKDEHLPCVTY